MLYPLTFRPIFKTHLWGGRRLARLYRKDLPVDVLVGESWEISDRDGAASVIANGPFAGKDLRWLMENHAAEVLGRARAARGRFPLLVKILDCQEAPSLQVHPRPDVADRLGGDPKTEIWYVTEAPAEGRLYVGLRPGVKRMQFERKTGDASVMDCLHEVRVRVGDAMLVPGGRVHAIGAGTVLIEIQQNSDTTFRVFDWNRTGSDGKPRELQVDQAMAAIDFDDFEPQLVKSVFTEEAGSQVRILADVDAFMVQERRVPSSQRSTLGALDRPTVLGVASGTLTVRHPGSDTTLNLSAGEFCLFPAGLADVAIESETTSTYLLASPGIPEAEPESLSPEAPKGVPVYQAHPGHHRSHHSAPEDKPVTVGGRWRRLKHNITKRLTYSPFLKIMILNPWFRSVVLVLLALASGTALFLPKMWRSTPPDFMPVIKISLLDRVQAWMLRRSAEKYLAGNRLNDAAEAWESAFGNDAGNPELARGLIRTVMRMPELSNKHIVPAVSAVPWLLRLSETNHADVELVVNLLDRAQLQPHIYQLLNTMSNRYPASLRPAYAKALFFGNHMDEYIQLWQNLPDEARTDPELSIIQDAFLAGWGPPETAPDARRRLNVVGGAEAQSPLRHLANRLLLAVSRFRGDVTIYGEALARLTEAHEDAGVEHAVYWRLLASTGQKDKARQLAQEYVFPPRTSEDLVRLASAYTALELNDEALKLMKRYVMDFGLSQDVWILFTNLLIASKDWEDLRAAALEIRRYPILRSRLEGISHYYEGRADLASGRTAAAEAAFDRAATAGFLSASHAMTIAQNLLDIGFPRPARLILERIDAAVTDRNAFNGLRFKAAAKLRDEIMLLRVAKEMHDASPRDALAANRYAAALLIEGKHPEEAIAMTQMLFKSYPNSAAARLNHALALLQNQRPADADAVLAEVDLKQTTAEERNSYHVARFEYYRQLGRVEDARNEYRQVALEGLFPSERELLLERYALMTGTPR